MSSPKASVSVRIQSCDYPYQELQEVTNLVNSLLESLLIKKLTGPKGISLTGVEQKYYANGGNCYTQHQYEIVVDFTLLPGKPADPQT